MEISMDHPVIGILFDMSVPVVLVDEMPSWPTKDGQYFTAWLGNNYIGQVRYSPEDQERGNFGWTATGMTANSNYATASAREVESVLLTLLNLTLDRVVCGKIPIPAVR